MSAEGMREKASAVAAHVAGQIKLYERHADEQTRKAELSRLQAVHLNERAQQMAAERDDEVQGTIRQLHREHEEKYNDLQRQIVVLNDNIRTLTSQLTDSRRSVQQLQESLNTKKLEHEDLRHQHTLLDHSKSGALQERTDALNKVALQEKEGHQQTWTIQNLREKAVIDASQVSLAKAETTREKERADDWENNAESNVGGCKPVHSQRGRKSV